MTKMMRKLMISFVTHITDFIQELIWQCSASELQIAGPSNKCEQVKAAFTVSGAFEFEATSMPKFWGIAYQRFQDLTELVEAVPAAATRAGRTLVEGSRAASACAGCSSRAHAERANRFRPHELHMNCGFHGGRFYSGAPVGFVA